MQIHHRSQPRRDWLRGAAALPAALMTLGSAPTLVLAQRAAAPPERRLLQQRFSASNVQAALLSREQWTPWPRRPDRAAWTRMDSRARKALLDAGEQALTKPWPPLPATLFLEYKREGNRARYEDPSFARRYKLRDLVLAECAEGNGRFLDEIANGVWLICEETYWGIPAHVNAQRAGVDLPDVEEPTVDLFAAETGALLAWTNYLLGDALQQVSALLPRRMSFEVQRRILQPNAERDDFWWMGLGPNQERAMNNWNPWINSNWLACNLLEEADPTLRATVTHKIIRSLDRFLDAYHTDGGCDEGPGYWSRAGGSLFECLELLYSGTAGKLNAFDMPLVQEMGRFVYRAHIGGEYYLNFADAMGKVRVDSDLVYRYGKRIGDAKMQALASYTFHGKNDANTGIGSIMRALPAAFSYAEMAPSRQPPPLVRDVWLDGIQVMTARRTEGSTDGLYLAAKGGHNAESHNHNDIGHFVIYLNSAPAIVDVGVETYSAKTFSANRYEIWTMQSAYHSLPTIDGVMQAPGQRYAARSVRYAANDAEVCYALDIAGAYPPEARLQSWNRELRYLRGDDRVQLLDRYACSAAPRELTLSLMTPCMVREAAPGELRLSSAELGSAGLAIHFDGLAFSWKAEEIPLEDARLQAVWGSRLYRILLRASQPQQSGEWQISFQAV